MYETISDCIIHHAPRVTEIMITSESKEYNITVIPQACNPLSDVEILDCDDPELCRTVFRQGSLGELVAKVNASYVTMLDTADQRVEDVRRLLVMSNSKIWTTADSIYKQVCKFKKNVTDIVARVEHLDCPDVVGVPLDMFDAAADAVLGCFHNATLGLLYLAKHSEDFIIQGSVERVRTVGRVLEDCIPELKTCVLSDEEIDAVESCVAADQDAIPGIVHELDTFIRERMGHVSGEASLAIQKATKCFITQITDLTTKTAAFLQSYKRCAGALKDEL